MKSSNDLRKKLIWFSITVVMVPMIILYITILAFFANRSVQENQRYAYHNMQSISGALDSAFRGLNELSLFMLANQAVRNYLVQPTSSQLFERVNTSLQLLPFSSKYYNTVSVISDRRATLYSGVNTTKFLSQSDREKADALQGTSFWTIRPGDVSLVRLMRDVNKLSNNLGYIKIEVNQNAIAEMLTSPEGLPTTSYMLLTDAGAMLSRGTIPDGLQDLAPFSFDMLKGQQLDSRSATMNGREYLYSSRSVFDDKVVLLSLLDASEVYSIDSLLIGSIVIALALSAFFSSMLIVYYNRRVFDPLQRLGQVMVGIEQKDFDTDYTIPGNNEITMLVEQFNLMCRRLKMMHEQVYLSEIKLREAELAALQSEINPHFLYNTLDTIYWMSEMSGTWKVSEMVKSLSKLFRIALTKSPGGLVPLLLEREYIECYLQIQQVRYQDQIRFEFYVQDGLQDELVLKLLLQPIVENAIIHGVEPEGGGRVVINIFREEDELIYTVFNEGKAVDVAELNRLKLEDSQEKRGFAIRNVDTRIRLRFGEGYGLSFSNQPGGVLATVRQPATEQEAEQ